MHSKIHWPCTLAILGLAAILVIGPVFLCAALDVSTYDDFTKPMIDKENGRSMTLLGFSHNETDVYIFSVCQVLPV